jgi:hypothetical protein
LFLIVIKIPITKYFVNWGKGKGRELEKRRYRRETSAHYCIDRSTLQNPQLDIPLSGTYHDN